MLNLVHLRNVKTHFNRRLLAQLPSYSFPYHDPQAAARQNAHENPEDTDMPVEQVVLAGIESANKQYIGEKELRY